MPLRIGVVRRNGNCAREAVALRGYIHAKAILFRADSENDVEHVVFGFVLHILINGLIIQQALYPLGGASVGIKF